jgi:hypothetical protein
VSNFDFTNLTNSLATQSPKTPSPVARMRRTDVVWKLVRAEVERAARKHPAFNSHHEGYAVLLEEVDELWDDVKADDHDHAIEEAIQVAAMAVRFITDCGKWAEIVTPGVGRHESVPMLAAHFERRVREEREQAERSARNNTPVRVAARRVSGALRRTWARIKG